MSEQKFGGVWTIQKLNAVENYLKAYTTALKNKGFKLIYIDAFAGSGTTKIEDSKIFDENQMSMKFEEIDSTKAKDDKILEGSAIRALKYPFDKFKFFEVNKQYCNRLEAKIKENYWGIDYNIIMKIVII